MYGRKIIFVAKSFDSNVSGPSNIVRELIREFKTENIPYEAVLLKEGLSKKEFFINLINILRREDQAVINVHTEGLLIPLLVFFLSFFFVKHTYYLTVHGIYKIDSAMNGKKKWEYIYIERFLYKYFPNLICVSEMQKNNISKLFKRDKNVIVIPNGTDATSNVKHDNSNFFEIISLGGLKKIKGIDKILNLAIKIKELGLNWHISLYGPDDSNEKWFESEVCDKKIRNIVEYKGMLKNKQEVYDRIKKADVQLCLSIYDTFNVAIAESLILGCPCVTTNSCGASYLVKDNYNGIVIDEKDDEAKFINAIIDYMNSISPELRMDIERKAIEYKEVLSWESVAREYRKLGGFL